MSNFRLIKSLRLLARWSDLINTTYCFITTLFDGHVHVCVSMRVLACVRTFCCLTIIQLVYICLYVTYTTPCALHVGRHTFTGSSTTPRRCRQFNIFEIHLTIIVSMNNRITLCKYYVQLLAALCEQIFTIAHNVVRLFYDCPKLLPRGQDVTRRYYYCQYYIAISKILFSEAINILTGCTKA